MADYYSNEAVFELAERPFADKTIHGLESKLPGEGTLGVFVHRRALDSERKLRDIVDESIALNEKRLIGFTVLDDAAVTVGGLPGVALRTRWRKGGATFYQAQAHVLLDQKWLVFAVSAPVEERAVCDETLDGILATLSWRTA